MPTSFLFTYLIYIFSNSSLRDVFPNRHSPNRAEMTASLTVDIPYRYSPGETQIPESLIKGDLTAGLESALFTGMVCPLVALLTT